MSLLRRLWRLEGTVGRGTYVAIGVGAAVVKYAIDYCVATFAFGQRWTPLSYWRLIAPESKVSPAMFLTLLAISLPFLWLGMSLTLLRLRDAGRSGGWAACFFAPVLNVVLFLTLIVLPHRAEARAHDRSGVMETALFSVLGTVALGAVMVAISTRYLAMYGLGLFIAVPFCVGYVPAFVQARREDVTQVQPYFVASASIVLLGGLLLALAWEGVACLMMAFPIAIALALFGAMLGSLSGAARPRPPASASAYLPFAVLPLLLFAESAIPRVAPVYRVDTDVVINAPIDRVWRNVVTFSTIDEPPDWYFRAGIAYPLRASISGRGPGAIRRCEFTTGAFVEPIEVWNEPRLLRFGVTSNPPPMQELSPYGAIDARHLHGFLESQRGQFLLEPLAGGRTRVTGTTWYRHNLWPAAYWRLWSDAIIHRIHLRVLRHVKALSESDR